MAERRYQKVHSRSEVMLLPPCLDDYVSGHNPVRAIDAFVGTLDLQALGFAHTEATPGAGQWHSGRFAPSRVTFFGAASH